MRLRSACMLRDWCMPWCVLAGVRKMCATACETRERACTTHIHTVWCNQRHALTHTCTTQTHAGVYKQTTYHKQTKNQWARDDPAFTGLCFKTRTHAHMHARILTHSLTRSITHSLTLSHAQSCVCYAGLCLKTRTQAHTHTHTHKPKHTQSCAWCSC
jgi:hypothetical protein